MTTTAEASSNLIPVTLLTGFLGSGKTTVLNHLVSRPELADALVIINEFGEMALDHLLVAHSTENQVLEMSSGCLCCTTRSDLVKTLRDITWRFSRNGQRQFRRVLIETTGLADPAPIIHTLMNHPWIAPKYRLDGIVATVDMATGMHTLDQHPEAVKQAAVADVLLLTKADLVTDGQCNSLMRRLDGINPAAPRWDVCNGEIAPRKVLHLGLFSTDGKSPNVARWLREEAYTSSHDHDHEVHEHSHGHAHDRHDVNRHDDHIRAFCYRIDDPIPKDVLATWLELLTSSLGNDILRVKGILNVEGNEQPIVVHGVQHVFHPPALLPAWPSEDHRSRVVFITRNVDREMVERTFQSLQQTLPQAGESAT
ncbi:GTP-binding protein [Castellaniella sp. MT123]|uniref:CobW family GTP-binding protein n=1 Tax=Castellaniella sp. MT123 TaxID=3140381 RepID=UPI0031F40E96